MNYTLSYGIKNMSCMALLFATGSMIIGADKPLTLDEKITKIETAASNFQEAIDNLVLKPDMTITTNYITTPVIEKKYVTLTKMSNPFSTLTEAKPLITELKDAALSAAQKERLQATLENIQISLTNMLIVANASYLVTILANGLFNRAQLVKQKNDAYKASSELYKYDLNDYISLGVSPDTVPPMLNNAFLENLAATKKNVSDMQRKLNAITAQSMATYLSTAIVQVNRDMAIGIAPEEVKNILLNIIKKATQDNKAPVDIQVLQTEFDKLKKADQQTLFSVLIYKPATNLDISISDAQKKLGA